MVRIGRPPLNGVAAMTDAERMRRYRARKAEIRKSLQKSASPAAPGPDEAPLVTMLRAWEHAGEADRAEILARIAPAPTAFRNEALPLRNIQPPAANGILTERDFTAEAIGALFVTARTARSKSWRSALNRGIRRSAVDELLTRFGDWKWRTLDRMDSEFEPLVILLARDYDAAARFGVVVEKYGRDPAAARFRLRSAEIAAVAG